MAVGPPAACWVKGVAVRVYVGAVGVYAGKVCWDSCWALCYEGSNWVYIGAVGFMLGALGFILGLFKLMFKQLFLFHVMFERGEGGMWFMFCMSFWGVGLEFGFSV